MCCVCPNGKKVTGHYIQKPWPQLRMEYAERRSLELTISEESELYGCTDLGSRLTSVMLLKLAHFIM